MKSKVALVTGAAQGIGFATAKTFAEEGAIVILADWDETLVKNAAEKLNKEGYQTLAFSCDVSNEDEVKSMIDTIIGKYGRLDYAYNNAGVQNVLANAADQTKTDYDRVTGVNLFGVWACMKYELQQMRRQGFGAIVNCSSLGGVLGGAERGIYHASKHGVIGLTTSAALEYASLGIRINCVSPGIIHTPMADKMIAGGQAEVIDAMVANVPVKRLGRPEEIANAVVWLCSDKASLVVGHNLIVDGGYTIQ